MTEVSGDYVGKRWVWPGSCGWPQLFTYSSATSTPGACFRIDAVNAAGLTATGDPICPAGGAADPDTTADPAPEGSDDGGGGGCQVGGRAPWSLALILVFGLLVFGLLVFSRRAVRFHE